MSKRTDDPGAARRRSAAPARSGAARAALLAAAALLAGCRLPEFTRAGEAQNVAVAGALAYVALGESGLAIHELPSGRELARIAPPAGLGSVDDVALADGLLFALDARTPGALAVCSLREPAAPAALAPGVGVAVGPFSGVAAARGRVVVSGGTSRLAVLPYDARGALGTERVELDLGRGQPDVALSDDGRLALVSTHFSLLADTFGVTILALATPPAPARVLARIDLPEAGFAPGGARPANFPLVARLDGATLWIASGGGLAAFDLAEPSAPRAISKLALPFVPVHLDVAAGRVVLVGSSPAPALLVVDGRDPRTPSVATEIALPPVARPIAVALAGDVAVVAARAAGLLVVPLPDLVARATSSPAGRGSP